MPPITWQNVAAPNFTASNQLRKTASDQLQAAGDSLSNRFIAEGDRRKEINTDKGIAFASGLQQLDNFEQQKAKYMASLGSNADASAISDAFSAQLGNLRDTATFKTDQSAAADDLLTSAAERKVSSAELAEMPDRLKMEQDTVTSRVAANNSLINLRNFEQKQAEKESKEKDQLITYTNDARGLYQGLLKKIGIDNFSDTKFLDAANIAGIPEDIAGQILEQQNKNYGITSIEADEAQKQGKMFDSRNKQIENKQKALDELDNTGNIFKAYTDQDLKSAIPDLQSSFFDLSATDATTTKELWNVLNNVSGKIPVTEISKQLRALGTDRPYTSELDDLATKLNRLELRYGNQASKRKKALEKERDILRSRQLGISLKELAVLDSKGL